MRTRLACCLGLFLLAAPARAADTPGRVVEDTWSVAYLEGGKAGFVRTTMRAVERDGIKLLRATTELNLTLKRFGDTIQLRMESGTDETPDGKVVGVSMRQHLGRQQQLVLTGTVEGDRLHVQVDGGKRQQKMVAWKPDVLGLYRQEHFFEHKQLKPGDRFRYASFEPTINAVITTRITVGEHEEVEVLGAKKKLLRVEAASDPIGDFRLPPTLVWLDDKGVQVRSQMEVPGLGKLLLYRTTKERALASNGRTAHLTDIGMAQLIKLNRAILWPHSEQTIVYRVTFDGDKPETAFAQDGRQEVRDLQGKTFELHVRASRGPADVADPAKKAPEEFLQSNYFVKSDDAKVKQLTAEAVGAEADPWQKALRIEKWVHGNLRTKNFSEAFATADQVARTLEGDCTEHAMLAAAMCRAAGVPSRTAIGLMYVDAGRGPSLGYHMWAEVWARGQWRPIDATLGKGYVGATHLKITDHSWHDTQSLTPLLPVLRVLGKLRIEVVRVSRAN